MSSALERVVELGADTVYPLCFLSAPAVSDRSTSPGGPTQLSRVPATLEGRRDYRRIPLGTNLELLPCGCDQGVAMARASTEDASRRACAGRISPEQLALFEADEYLSEFHARMRDLFELRSELRWNERAMLAEAMRRWPCPVCGGMPVPEPEFDQRHPLIRTYFGADPCLGWLPGVAFACCGHDREWPDEAYVVIPGRGTWHGDEAKMIMRDLGGNPP